MRAFTFIFVLIPLWVSGQLVTSTSQSPSQLVQNVLLGPGVNVSNISFQGASQAIGSFDGTNTTLGFNKGILITTGTVNAGPNGPNGPNKKGDATVNNNAAGYSRLTQLVGAQTYNASVLEFDFVPYSDTVTFRYIFGSEEYREYVNSDFNDVFAFFISGPGFSGYQNIAKLPNNTPVTINNINDGYINNGTYVSQCNNCQYFTYNGDGSQSPYNSDPKYIQYDGFTKPLEAVAKVECGKKYHLIIAIADVNDALYDSGIFLEANSLKSKIVANVDYALSYDAYGDNKTMSEGCASATFTISRPAENATQTLVVPITVSGSATMGVDYSNVPSSITLNPGETSKTFTIQTIADALTEGTENIILTFGIPDACGNDVDKQFELFIADIDKLTVTIDGADKNCPNQQVVLTAKPVGGAGPYHYSWSTGETTSSITVSPNATQTYTVTVKESCMNKTADTSFTVHVAPYKPMKLFPSNNIVEPCRYKNNTLEVGYTDGAPAYSITWKDSEGNALGTDSLVVVAPGKDEVYTFSVTDGCGYTYDTSITYTITTQILTLDSILAVRACPGMPVTFTAVAHGGYGQYYYKWNTNESTSTVTVAPTKTTTYTVSVSDECQTYKVTRPAKVIIEIPKADFEVVNYPLTQGQVVVFQNTSSYASTYDWAFGDSLDPTPSTKINPTHTYEEPGGYVIRLIAISDLGCSDTVYKSIEVMPEFYIYVPNAFTPNGDRHNQYFEVSTVNIIDFKIRIYNRWGENIFESTDQRFKWDGTYKGMMVTDDVYVWVIDYTAITGFSERKTGHITVIR